MPMNDTRARGFTLLETLLVLTLVGILAGLAYPSYARHLRQGERQSVQTALQQQLLLQEQYRAQHQRYAEFRAGEPGELPFHADTGRADSRYLLGARACKDDHGQAVPLSDCILAFAQPAASGSKRPSFAMDSVGRRHCPDEENFSDCWD